MKLKAVLLGGLVLGVGAFSSVKLFASCQVNEKYRPDVVYTVKNSASASTTTFAQDEYKELFYEVLKDYFILEQSQLPKDAKLTITIEDRKTINESNAKALAAEKAAMENGDLPEEEYNDFKKFMDLHANDTYDQIKCVLAPESSDDMDKNDSYRYIVIFNSETKEILMADVPISEAGHKILADDGAATVSLTDLQVKYADLIKTYKLGGILNPQCISDQMPRVNQPGCIPCLIYQDEQDANKRVTIAVDGATGSINYIYVW